MDFLCIYEGVLAFIYSIYFIEIKAAIRFRILFIYSFRLVGRLVPGKIIGLAWILYTGTLAENDTGPPALTIIRNSLQTGRACLTLVKAGGANIILCRKSRDFSTTEHSIDLRPVCKFKFLHCASVEEKQSALSVCILLMICAFDQSMSMAKIICKENICS